MRAIPNTAGQYRSEGATDGRDLYTRSGRFLGHVHRTSIRGWAWRLPDESLCATLADAAHALDRGGR